jgi:esterase
MFWVLLSGVQAGSKSGFPAFLDSQSDFWLFCTMGQPLYYTTLGQGPPLVILHGVFGSGENWATVSKIFADHFTVWLPDQRNHGRSPHDPVHTYAAMADDLKKFAVDHVSGPFFLIGHSMGGKVAMHAARLYPELLRKIVVVDIAPRSYEPHHQSVISGLQAVPLDTVGSRTEAASYMAPFIQEEDVRQFLLKNLYRNQEGRFSWRINLPVLARAVSEIGGELPPGPPIDVPALFVKGGKSRYINDADMSAIPLRFPRSEFAVVEDAGHWVQAEKPAEFARLVLSFLLHD